MEEYYISVWVTCRRTNARWLATNIYDLTQVEGRGILWDKILEEHREWEGP